jgi:phosphatidylethanolamine-binding protein (PEBP) family uncharacterized protein
VNGTNDGETAGYTGPCPPEGDVTHRYTFTVVAINVPSLGLPATTHGAVAGFVIGHAAIGSASFVATARQ